MNKRSVPLKNNIMSNFLSAKIYKLILSAPVFFKEEKNKNEKVIFTPKSEIKIVSSYEGGGCGFGGLSIYEITIKDDAGSKTFTEKCLHYENTPLHDFIKNNVGSIFEIIAEV